MSIYLQIYVQMSTVIHACNHISVYLKKDATMQRKKTQIHKQRQNICTVTQKKHMYKMKYRQKSKHNTHNHTNRSTLIHNA